MRGHHSWHLGVGWSDSMSRRGLPGRVGDFEIRFLCRWRVVGLCRCRFHPYVYSRRGMGDPQLSKSVYSLVSC